MSWLGSSWIKPGRQFGSRFRGLVPSAGCFESRPRSRGDPEVARLPRGRWDLRYYNERRVDPTAREWPVGADGWCGARRLRTPVDAAGRPRSRGTHSTLRRPCKAPRSSWLAAPRSAGVDWMRCSDDARAPDHPVFQICAPPGRLAATAMHRAAVKGCAGFSRSILTEIDGEHVLARPISEDQPGGPCPREPRTPNRPPNLTSDSREPRVQPQGRVQWPSASGPSNGPPGSQAPRLPVFAASRPNQGAAACSLVPGDWLPHLRPARPLSIGSGACVPEGSRTTSFDARWLKDMDPCPGRPAGDRGIQRQGRS